jgi:agmatinase
MKRTFGNIPAEFGDLEGTPYVLVPVPYDGTSTWVKGADQGPEALLHAAENMELYDVQLDSEIYTCGIGLDEPLTGFSSPENMVAAVESRVLHWLDRDQMPILIGGEHSVSIGAIKAYVKQYPGLTILQLDAHADLRESYEGSACNHACAVHWASQNTNLVQVGIRSMDVSEKEFMDMDNTFFAHDITDEEKTGWEKEVIDRCGPQVYVTIDLDVFDPSVLPSTGTPEPGGLTWNAVTKFIELLSKKREVVGFDIVELCPNKIDKASDFLAAKLLYKIIGYVNEYKDYDGN